MIYSRLRDEISAMDERPSRIVCDPSVDETYRRVVSDVAEAMDVEHDVESSGTVRARFVLLLTSLVVLAQVASVVVDELLSVAFYAVRGGTLQSDIVVFPAINRQESILPVLEEFDTDPLVALTLPTIYLAARRAEYRELLKYRTVTVHQFSTLGTVAAQVRDVGRILFDLTVSKRLATGLIDSIEDAFDVRLGNSVPFVLWDAILDFRLLRAILLRRPIRRMLDWTGCEKTVICTLDPIGRSILNESLEQGIRGYHLPHSIATPHPPNPPSATTQFVSGTLDVAYYEAVVPDDLAWNWVPLGRPRLSDLYNRYERGELPGRRTRWSNRDRQADFQVLIATQPFSDEVRSAFVSDVLDGVRSARDDVSVLIKVHPDEDPAHYRDVAASEELISVTTSDLYGNLLDSDVVFTINSNVGLESVVVGTPCVCLNRWRHRHLDPTYTFSGAIPVFRSRSAVVDLFSGDVTEEIARLRSTQMEFLRENYRLDAEVPADIARYIVED